MLDALQNVERSDRAEEPDAAVSAGARSACEWIGVPDVERAGVLEDLLLTADALPVRRRPTEMKPDGSLSLPAMIVALDTALEEADLLHTIGGAIAVAYYGEPRMTADIDINVFTAPEDWPRVRSALAPLGIDASVSEDAPMRDGQLRLSWNRRRIDLFFSHDLLHAAMPAAARRVPFAGGTIPIIAPEHLVVRKAVLGRPKDWIDIEQILVATEPLDIAEIQTLLERMTGGGDERLRALLAKLAIDG